MTKVDVISGFLGAGKTTLIRKLLQESLKNEQVVLIENEFGEIGIDGGFLKDSGVKIREMNSGCICCSLVGDFTASLGEVIETYHPDRIIIEPSGVGKLSDVIVAVQNATKGRDVELGSAVTVVDVQKCKMYMKNFGEFFNNQIESAGTIVLSRTGIAKPEKTDEAVALIREKNDRATVITTDWDKLSGDQILEAMAANGKLEEELIQEMISQVEEEEKEHEHELHHHDHDHDHHDHEHDHDHEHGDHDHEDHDHEHDHDHHHHHHHHADDVFTSWGFETPQSYAKADLEQILDRLGDAEQYGTVLRAKGMVPAADADCWYHFDLVPGEHEIRTGSADVTGRICVIGADIHTDHIADLFGKKD